MAADRILGPLALLCALPLALAACRPEDRPPPSPPAGAVRDWPAGELRSGGGEVEAALAGGEVHRYRLPLRQGDLLRLVVDQRGIDAAVVLEDPGGAEVLKADRLIDDRGLELVLAVAERSGDHRLVVQGLDGSGPGRYGARVEALRPASEADRRSAAAYRSFTGAEGLEPDTAMARWTAALATWRELGETALEGEVLARMARQRFDQRQWQASADLYREAAAVFARSGNPRWEALARNSLAANLLPLGDTEGAAGELTRAASLARRANDRLSAATAFHGLGQARQRQGELQAALDLYDEALKLWPEGHPQRPKTLHQLGVLHARYLHDERRGGELLLEAWNTFRTDAKPDRAATASQLGRLAYEQGRLDEARRYFEKALELRQDRACESAVFLARLALVEEGKGARPAADARMGEALRTVESRTCLRSEPTVRLLNAGLAEKRGDFIGARASYQRCEALYAGLGDHMGRAESLMGVAHADRGLGDLRAAREAIQAALEITEGVRPTVLREDLRTSFFSGVQGWFDTHIELLLEMGAADEAWATAERARSRALGDLLAEAGAGLRRTAPAALIARERELQRRLNDLEAQRLVSSESRPEKLRNIQAALDAKVAELETLRGDLRRGSPLYASLTRSEPLSAAARRELLDDGTVLLEYRLGERASTVWTVTRDAVAAARLPPRREIEPRVLEVANGLRSMEWPGRNPPSLCELSRTLLGPVAASLGRQRIVVVADGALEVLPFAALPVPGGPEACERAPALVDSHEIVSLPSAAALITQRRLLAGRQPASGWLAVVADPAYTPGQNLRRLPGTAREAAAITKGLPAGRFFLATGPAASRQTVTGGALRGFRILHFATHGILNPEQPLLSSLALARGGSLPAHEIYDLDLPAELVTLSACETALGRDVPGEGLVSGLPRAFLYAGAARVLVSLWEVEDQSASELITVFYRGLFQGLPPARALQEAQRTLRRQGRRPYQWAGFVLLGDWRPLPPFAP
ncbi:MAG TPA: CHAT domain-containing protein [Thermoanaerobaculia bacterium]